MPGFLLYGSIALPPVAAAVTLLSLAVRRLRAAWRQLDGFLAEVTSLDPRLRARDFRQG